MKTVTKILIALGILLLIAPSCSAFTVTSATVSPDTPDFTTGEAVNVDVLMGFSGGFPGGEDLKFRTDLSSARWSYDIIIGGIPSPTPQTASGSALYIDGFNLEYPESVKVEVRVVLEGVAPETPTMSNKTILEISQIDATGTAKTGDAYTYSIERTIVNPEEIDAWLETQKTALASLRSDIDAKAALDVDTASAEAKYNEAKTALDTAETPGCTSQLTYINTAAAAIEEGQDLLNKAWAGERITDAETVLVDVDGYITYFTVNRSMPDDARVLAIISKRENAATSLSQAQEKFDSGLYTQSQTKADVAYVKAMEAYNASVDLKETIGEGGILDIFVNNILIIIGVIVAAVIIIAGVILFRRRSGWDELG